MKRETAVVFRCTPNLSFAVANMIVGIEKHNPQFVTDYVIFSTDNKHSDHDILYDICKYYNKNLRIINYSYEKLYKLNLDFNKSFFNRYPLIIFSLFEIFNLLNEYKHIIALDADMIVIDKITDIVKTGSFSFCPARPLNGLLNDGQNFENCITPNAGFIYINDKLHNYNNFTEKCYNILKRYFNNIKDTFEETVFGILVKEENIKYTNIGFKYNCPCCNNDIINAKIIHYIGVKKPWESLISLRCIPEYVYNVNLVNNITNNKYYNIDISRASIKNIFEKEFNLEYFKIFFNKISDMLPSYIYPEISPIYSFLSLFLKGVDKSIHYNIRIRKNMNNRIDYNDNFDYINRVNKISYIELWIVFENYECKEGLIKEYILKIMDKKNFILQDGKFFKFYKKIDINNIFEELIFNINELHDEIININAMFELKKRGK